MGPQTLTQLSKFQAMKAQANLRKCADSQEPSLLVYTKYECSRRPKAKFRPLVPPGISALVFIGDFLRIHGKNLNLVRWGKYRA